MKKIFACKILKLHIALFKQYKVQIKAFVKVIINVYISIVGVGHAMSSGFSSQLAAAHLLERLRIFFASFRRSPLYALFPGCRYTKMRGKLQDLCQTYSLGEVHFNVRVIAERNGRDRAQLERKPRFECSCVVKNQETCGTRF